MTPDEHAAEALRLLKMSERLAAVDAANEIARAQVHAILSLRAAAVPRQSGFAPRSEFTSADELNEQLSDDDGEGFRVRDWYSGDDPGKAILDDWDDSDPGA
ncbi:hypothetical protein DMB66_33130 [Actinoplanes sp. ATCC 53533]|uniref:hypothetical protein n=1 Tax=Actinoplanes sp. ATCC 53533 TaxID=1288362 RepID=UPI000F7B46F3|nr:hypothetical protein [Actinoplanes sp. ATCC 53533]RSM56696.1 hypothetical protein DMB66_33130 [Actinoplanes sp. ATCC 53533]